MKTAWNQIRTILKQTVSPGLYKVWISPLTADGTGGTLLLTAPNEFVATWVRERLMGDILQAATQALGYKPEVRVLASRASGSQPGQVGLEKSGAPLAPAGFHGLATGTHGTGSLPAHAGAVTSTAPAAQVARAVPAHSLSRTLPQGSQVGLPLRHTARERSWKFSFDEFVVGPSNELAYAAAKGVCTQTLSSEQLFISSSPGLGKTHLLQAVGHQLCKLSNRDRVRVEYLTAEEFCSQMFQAIKSKEMQRFKSRFREAADVLLLEDIHFFQGKQTMQDEMLATLKTLQTQGKVVVFTSSFLPRELKDVDSSLASRFCSGFLAVIERPDFETRKRILQTKAKKIFQVVLPEEVAELLAGRIKDDIRQLESCLQNLVLKAKLLNRAITLDLAMGVVSDFAAMRLELDLEAIIRHVCENFELSRDQLSSKSRKRQIVLARNTAFFLARKHTDLSLKDIGDKFNRRHSTVLKGIANVEREITRESPLGRQIVRAVELVETCRP